MVLFPRESTMFIWQIYKYGVYVVSMEKTYSQCGSEVDKYLCYLIVVSTEKTMFQCKNLGGGSMSFPRKRHSNSGKLSTQSMLFPRKQRALYSKFMQGMLLPRKIEIFLGNLYLLSKCLE
jgi:hypothetical protein